MTHLSPELIPLAILLQRAGGTIKIDDEELVRLDPHQTITITRLPMEKRTRIQLLPADIQGEIVAPATPAIEGPDHA